MSKRKFRVGDEVAIHNGEVGVIVGPSPRKRFDWSVLIGDDTSPTVYTHDELTLAPMTSRPSYLRGVALADERRENRERLLIDRYASFATWGYAELAPSLTAAKAHRDAQREKYATEAKMTVKFTPVAKGSEPMRVNDYTIRRRSYRSLLARANRSGRTVHDEVVDFNVFAAEIGLPPILKRGGV